MTDYPASRRHRRATRAVFSESRKRSGLVAIFIFIILLFVIVGGFLKASLPAKAVGDGAWSGETGLAIVMNSKPPALVVYGKEAAKIGVFVISPDLKYATGDAKEPIKAVDSVFLQSGEEAVALLTNLSGINVSKYLYFKTPPEIDEKHVNLMFKDFSSWKTPLAVVFGKRLGIEESNLSTVELLKLWWEVKGLTLDQVKYASVSAFSEDIMGPGDSKFKTIDRQSFNRELTTYLLGAASGNLKIINSSGVSAAGVLAADMLNAYGWNVVDIEPSENIEKDCRIIAGPGRGEAELLASLSGCNIIREQNSAGNIIIILGSHFANRYY